MLPVEDERDKMQQSDQMILFPDRQNKRGQVFRNGDKPSLPEEADSHKNGSSSRVLLHLKSNRSWKLLFCGGNICASAKPPKMRGKGGTLSGGQVTGDLPYRGARGTLPGGQVIPLSFPLSQ